MKEDSKRERTDVIVIGGGLVGCATAYYLARRGRVVRIIERARIGSEQSGRAWGLLRQQGRHPAEMPLASEALRIWPDLPDALGANIELVRDGILVLAESAEDEARLVDGARASREHGIDSRLLEPREIRSLVPQLADRWRVGLYTRQDGHVEPIKATQAFAAAARRLGVIVHEDTPVFELETSAGSVSGVVTPAGVFRADSIVCAAGIGSASICRTAGVSLPIQTVRAVVAQTLSGQPTTRIPVWAPQAAFRPKVDGSFYIGNGYRGIDAEHDLTPESLQHFRKFFPTYVANRRTVRLRLGRPFLEAARRHRSRARFHPLPEPEINQRLVDANLRGFTELFPHLEDLAVARAWAGRIDATPDLIPIIGTLPSQKSCFVAAGFNGHGLALAPAVGRALAELIVDGRSTIDLRPLRVERYAEGDFRHFKNAL